MKPSPEPIVIDEEQTDDSVGFYPDRRSIEQLLQYGFILVDKPEGPTSHEVVAWVKRILHSEKAGHSGTLDPGVTGLLPIGLGEATKALSVLLLGPKEYYCVARLHDPIDGNKLKRVLSEFVGEIYQRPPQRSSVRRETRTRNIYALDLFEDVGRLLLLRVLCQAGTYVRKLIYDIGEVLGPGATMFELRRTRVSHLGESDGFVSLHQLYDAYQRWLEEREETPIRSIVKPVEYAVSGLNSAVIRDSAVDAICHGAQLAVPGLLRISPSISRGEIVAIFTLKGELVAISEAMMSSEEIQKADRGIAFLTRRVIMKPSTYPKLWKTKEKQTIKTS